MAFQPSSMTWVSICSSRYIFVGIMSVVSCGTGLIVSSVNCQPRHLGLQLAKQNLLNETEKGFQKNLACSPLSIAAMMNMLSAGSSKHGLKDRLSSLGCETMDELDNQSLQLMDVVSSKDTWKTGEPLFTFVNGCWIDQRFSLKPSFTEILQNIYKVEPKALDFENNKGDVVEKVNSWVNNETKGLIKEILKNLDDQTALILANALYFKGIWEDPFVVEMTKDDKFYLLNGEEVEVPFMYRGPGTHLYGSFDGFKVLKLPYKNKQDQRQFSMYFYLPDERDGLKNLLQQLNPSSEFLKHQLMLKKERIRNIRIPKFKFPYDFDVSKVIESLGLTQPSIALHSPDGNEVVGPATAIEHKAYIEVNEMGTEAAAVTLNCVAGCAQFQKPPSPLTFKADHPFMFMIMEDMSRIPLFVGAVVNPLFET